MTAPMMVHRKMVLEKPKMKRIQHNRAMMIKLEMIIMTIKVQGIKPMMEVEEIHKIRQISRLKTATVKVQERMIKQIKQRTRQIKQRTIQIKQRTRQMTLVIKIKT